MYAYSQASHYFTSGLFEAYYVLSQLFGNNYISSNIFDVTIVVILYWKSKWVVYIKQDIFILITVNMKHTGMFCHICAV